MKTKTKILSAACDLFNKQGYSHVTIRMIAQELNMSSGNLNYHFKKREDILEALYFEMVAEFDERIEKPSDKNITLITVKNEIVHSLNRMVRYRFFWTDLYNLLNLNEKIKSHFQGVYSKRRVGYQKLFVAFVQVGLMKEFESPKEKAFLIDRMIDFSNTCLYNSALYDKAIDDNYVQLQADNMLAMLRPYLSDLGKQFDH